jgi:hypothetical protein
MCICYTAGRLISFLLAALHLRYTVFDTAGELQPIKSINWLLSKAAYLHRLVKCMYGVTNKRNHTAEIATRYMRLARARADPEEDSDEDQLDEHSEEEDEPEQDLEDEEGEEGDDVSEDLGFDEF